MAGIYLHIPFCKQACNYCDFHFSTNLQPKAILIDCIAKELKSRKKYLNNESIDSIYFGGGTPSLLTHQELALLLETIFNLYNVSNQAEITLEANPDDISEGKIKEFFSLGINRLSIGIQSFNNEQLKFMNRAHTAMEASNAIKIAQDNGITNLTIDLIYGIPSSNHDILITDLNTAFQLNTPHISAYCLTIEEKTVFGHQLKKGIMKPIDDEFAAQQYEIMVNAMEQNGYEQYEISNFAQNEHYAIHNSNYWKQQNYLGVGPGAHSFDGKSRQFNIANNNQYIKLVQTKGKFYTKEDLSLKDITNEYILTSLRTKWGCDLNYLNELNPNFLKLHQETIEKLISRNLVMLQNQILYLSKEGKILADSITEEFFII